MQSRCRKYDVASVKFGENVFLRVSEEANSKIPHENDDVTEMTRNVDVKLRNWIPREIFPLFTRFVGE